METLEMKSERPEAEKSCFQHGNRRNSSMRLGTAPTRAHVQLLVIYASFAVCKSASRTRQLEHGYT